LRPRRGAKLPPAARGQAAARGAGRAGHAKRRSAEADRLRQMWSDLLRPEGRQ